LLQSAGELLVRPLQISQALLPLALKPAGDKAIVGIDGTIAPLRALGLIVRPLSGWLREAASAFRAALEEKTLERVPLDWTATRHNLNIAQDLIEARIGKNGAIPQGIRNADTQGQSEPVFGLCRLLGIKLMPRMRGLSDAAFGEHPQGMAWRCLPFWWFSARRRFSVCRPRIITDN
jgi:hypothetical protein